MSAKINAFPHYDAGKNFAGMTLRDWFAGQALPAIITATSARQHDPGTRGDDRRLIDRMASDAYDIADAMIAERQRRDA